MRLLFTTTPGFSHTTPLLPLAHGARLAGHRVLVVAGGPALRAAADSGLPTVDAVPHDDVTRPYAALAAAAAERDIPPDETMRLVFGAFGEISAMMLEGLVAAARRWGADAIVYTPMLSSGPIAARAVGARAVLHGMGLRHPAFPATPALIEAAGRRYGVDAADLRPDAELVLAPASLERVNPAAPPPDAAVPTLPTRPGPDNGGGRVPGWALSRGRRPRVVVTLGSVPSHTDGRQDVMAAALTGLADLGVEAVLTTGGAALDTLGPLPPWARAVGFVPLTSLLPSCDAVVHHGGMGTMFSALAAGVPQVIVPTTSGDALSNAEVVEKRGTGLGLMPAALSPASLAAAVGELLDEPRHRAASREVAAELTAMPHPGTVADLLAALPFRHRIRTAT
ncbi:glycosyltransferase [Streptomyces radicis]|uniref:Glycosyltransferase n=1 Tax=Streptomyces radicis TaxID=1750517 RepID=A0A3A9WFI2_9ACTN|nr:glycosyltransferase [Streptomyces radicis]RKN11549.1 glycosyltransferase [Streptomyces radicis]RKN26433.1 glycosyltransferase [Streptomyces radicis]